MSEHAATPQFEVPSLRDTARAVTGYWRVLLLSGVAWVAVALVILQVDSASVTTVGILAGAMFLALGVENVALARLDVPGRGVWALTGALFLVSAGICFAKPADTFAGLADVLGILFAIVGIWWMVRSFLERPFNPLWWLGLITGILMTALALLTAGQSFSDKAYVVLVLVGIWAFMQGISSIVRGLGLRALHKEL